MPAALQIWARWGNTKWGKDQDVVGFQSNPTLINIHLIKTAAGVGISQHWDSGVTSESWCAQSEISEENKYLPQLNSLEHTEYTQARRPSKKISKTSLFEQGKCLCMGRCHLSDCRSGPCLLCRRWALGCKWNAVASDNARVDTTCQDAASARPSLHSVYNSVSCVRHTSTSRVYLCFPVSITRPSRTVTH